MVSRGFRMPRVSLLVCVFLSGLQVALSGFEHNCELYRPSSPQGQCGNRLSDIISNVCIYYNGRRKRSASPPGRKQWRDQRSAPGQEQAADIFLPKHEALSVVSKRAIHAKGIICECCYFRCSFNEMAQYCSSSAFDGKKKRHSPDHQDLVASTWPSTAPPAATAPDETESALGAMTQEEQDIQEKQVIGWHIMKYGPAWLDPYLSTGSGSSDYAHAQAGNNHVMPGDADYRSG